MSSCCPVHRERRRGQWGGSESKKSPGTKWDSRGVSRVATALRLKTRESRSHLAPVSSCLLLLASSGSQPARWQSRSLLVALHRWVCGPWASSRVLTKAYRG